MVLVDKAGKQMLKNEIWESLGKKNLQDEIWESYRNML